MTYKHLQESLALATAMRNAVLASLLQVPFLERQDLPADLRAAMPTPQEELRQVLAALGIRCDAALHVQSFGRNLRDLDFSFGPGNTYIALRYARNNCGDEVHQFPAEKTLVQTAAGMLAWLKKEDDRSA